MSGRGVVVAGDEVEAPLAALRLRLAFRLRWRKYGIMNGKGRLLIVARLF